MNVAGFEFPDALYFHAEHQVWARLEGDGTATVGITAMGVGQAGEIYMCRPKRVGTVVPQGQGIAVVELAKSIVSVKSPVAGTVTAVNVQLETAPELVHTDPYGAGWLARLALHDWAADQAGLLQGDAVVPAMQHQAWLFRQSESPE
jgi:glycine cleavage system H protein